MAHTNGWAWPAVTPDDFDAAWSRPSIRAQVCVKHTIDRVAAVSGLAVLSPLLLAVGAAVRLESPGPAFFRQERVGEGGRVFRIFKFRTMTVPRSEGEADEARVTRLGGLLRRTSIDELPQLLNVARGEMSLVGPRPFLPHSYAGFDARLRRTFRVRPGVTGWAQVMGRNAQSWDEKFAKNLYYAEHFSLALDARILWRTVGVVLRQSDVGASAGSTVGTPHVGGGGVHGG